jgi:hypothetical protein
MGSFPRTQAVSVQGEKSTYLPVDSGVPQGSVPHCASLSRSLCRVRASLFDLITRYAIVSSAKSLIVESSPVGMSFM